MMRAADAGKWLLKLVADAALGFEDWCELHGYGEDALAQNGDWIREEYADVKGLCIASHPEAVIPRRIRRDEIVSLGRVRKERRGRGEKDEKFPRG